MNAKSAQRNATYNTRQRKAVLDYLQALQGAHVTADDVERHFASSGSPIGRTTVYRHLNKLVDEGVLLRISSGKQSPDCYEYIGASVLATSHLHLSCDDCGSLYHVECSELAEIQQHMAAAHAFKLNAASTVFRGVCKECARGA